MERILYFDCFAGISGDMTIAALLDLGINQTEFLTELEKLGLKGYSIEIEKVKRFSISGTDVKVILKDDFSCHHSHHGDHKHHNNHSHDHAHDEGERTLGHITHIINNSTISENAKKLSIDIFKEIAKAEAYVHGVPLDQVHFHEVGAVDSIVDIVGAAICIDFLKIDKVVCSPVHDGKGFVNCRHGRLPIPVPAVAQMLKKSGISLVSTNVEAELVTPTGFGILKTVKDYCGQMPPMEVIGTGYGFGKTETGSLNALRVFLGTGADEENHLGDIITDKVIMLETNIDDCTGEVLGYTIDKLMRNGALDAYFIPIQMKKNRPAYTLSVICKEVDHIELSKLIFTQTGSLGIRVTEKKRYTLERDIRTVQTEFGPINYKFAQLEGKTISKPEFDHCVKIAEEQGLSLKSVQEKLKK